MSENLSRIARAALASIRVARTDMTNRFGGFSHDSNAIEMLKPDEHHLLPKMLVEDSTNLIATEIPAVTFRFNGEESVRGVYLLSSSDHKKRAISFIKDLADGTDHDTCFAFNYSDETEDFKYFDTYVHAAGKFAYFISRDAFQESCRIMGVALPKSGDILRPRMA